MNFAVCKRSPYYINILEELSLNVCSEDKKNVVMEIKLFKQVRINDDRL